eukprot:TRINITY_DN3646_c0_g3_i1.p1 TRINITY_DN3646_c0_g3~~TRINITY_DN3646_c0_g3_i1.p1  ORF type:complete len:378 (-),score=102.93 TRINITY_DN3646_c0_g3_i1:456-1589(-)
MPPGIAAEPHHVRDVLHAEDEQLPDNSSHEEESAAPSVVTGAAAAAAVAAAAAAEAAEAAALAAEAAAAAAAVTAGPEAAQPAISQITPAAPTTAAAMGGGRRLSQTPGIAHVLKAGEAAKKAKQAARGKVEETRCYQRIRQRLDDILGDDMRSCVDSNCGLCCMLTVCCPCTCLLICDGLFKPDYGDDNGAEIAREIAEIQEAERGTDAANAPPQSPSPQFPVKFKPEAEAPEQQTMPTMSPRGVVSSADSLEVEVDTASLQQMVGATSAAAPGDATKAEAPVVGQKSSVMSVRQSARAKVQETRCYKRLRSRLDDVLGDDCRCCIDSDCGLLCSVTICLPCTLCFVLDGLVKPDTSGVAEAISSSALPNACSSSV